MVQRARELTVQAGNDTNDPSARADIAAEIDQLTEAIKQTGNTQYAGQYIFGGTANATPPYQRRGRRHIRRQLWTRSPARSAPARRYRSARTSRNCSEVGREPGTASF